MAKQMGDIVRYTPARQGAFPAFLIAAVSAVTVLNAIMFIVGIQMGITHPMDQARLLGVWLANSIFGLALILILYRRFFVDDMLVVKKRHPKYEDFLEKYDID